MVALVYLLTPNYASGQYTKSEQHKIDSLKHVIDTASVDSIKVNGLFDWDNIIYVYDQDLDMKLNQRIVDLCDTNLKVIKTLEEQTFYYEYKASALNNLGILEKKDANYKQATRYYKQSLDISEVISDSAGIANSYNNLALVYEIQGNPRQSLNYLFKSNEINTLLNDNLANRVRVLNNISDALTDLGKIDSALIFNKQALQLSLKTEEPWLISESYCRKSQIYATGGYYQEALQELNPALKYAYNSNDGSQIGTVFAQYGYIYQEMGKNDSCLYFYKKSLFHRLGVSDDIDIGSSYNNVAVAFKGLEQYDSALYYFQLAEDLAIKISDKSGLAGTLSNIGDIYYEQNNYKMAQTYQERAYKLIVPAKHLEYHTIIAERLYKTYKQLNMNDKALMLHEEFIGLRDSTNRLSNIEAILEAQIETHYQDLARIDSLKKADQFALLNEEAKTEKLQKRIVLLILLWIIIAAIGLYFWFRTNQKKRLVQIELNNEVNTVNAIMEGQEQERQRIAQELHDGICSSLLAVEILLQTGDTKATSELLRKSIHDIRHLSHEITPPDLEMSDLNQLMYELVEDLSPIIQPNLTQQCIGKFDHIKMQTKISVYRMIQEAITNSLKYAQAKNIEIQLNGTPNQLSILITDDGIGFDVDEKADGIGLTNIRKRAQLLNGRMKVDSSPGHGTSMLVTLKLD